MKDLSYDIKPSTLYPTRADPFYPELAAIPTPIASALDTSDYIWDKAVETTAWGVGLFVKPVCETHKGIKKRVGGAVDWTGVTVRKVGMRVGLLRRSKQGAVTIDEALDKTKGKSPTVDLKGKAPVKA
jgi:hypothetical protein